ncbi:MAG: hypothetical protein HFJ66_05775 [Eggerthellaceae bacterium]|nr:hypothetical protein [Eggerthellaceae bacterium]
MTATKRLFTCAAAVLVALVAAACLAFAAPAFAAEDPYSYTVRIYAGAQGSFDGKDYLEVQVDPTSENTQVTFNQASVTLKDSGKYYVRGIKEAGRDNDDTLSAPAFTVEGDADYVVSYGILGDNVAYTVRYVDAEGNELFPTEQFYGNVGDSPVLAYRYVEGYQPQAYNLTGELYADASQNVYTFVYEPVARPAQPEAPAEEEEPEAPTTPNATTTPGTTAPTTTTAPTAPAADEGLAAVPPATATINDDETPQAQGPAEIEDIRDDATPLASSAVPNAEPGSEDALAGGKNATMLAVAGAVAGVAALLLVLLLLLKRRKKEQPAEAVAIETPKDDDGSGR